MARAEVGGSDGTLYMEQFMVDTCADRIVLSAALLRKTKENKGVSVHLRSDNRKTGRRTLSGRTR